jgi:DNA (cytosine-5)-methyltransferase 1
VCSGIEAVTVAWQPLGWTPVAFAEIDPFCCWLLRSRYGASRPLYMPSPHDAPDRKEAKRRAAAIRNVIALPHNATIPNFGDFTRIGADDVGTIDLLAGGTPCQSFSIAGKRAGLDDARGNLTIEFARLADRLRPVWVVWENVPGVLSIDNGRTFGTFLGMLVQLGYGIAYRILDAQSFGVPQRRRRVFVVGHLGGWRTAAAVLLEFHCLSGHPPPRGKAWQDITPTLSARAHGGGGPGTDFDLDGGLITSTEDISRCLNAGGMGRQDFETETMIAHSLCADGFDASEDGPGAEVLSSPSPFARRIRSRTGMGFLTTLRIHWSKRTARPWPSICVDARVGRYRNRRQWPAFALRPVAVATAMSRSPQRITERMLAALRQHCAAWGMTRVMQTAVDNSLSPRH